MGVMAVSDVLGRRRFVTDIIPGSLCLLVYHPGILHMHVGCDEIIRAGIVLVPIEEPFPTLPNWRFIDLDFRLDKLPVFYLGNE